MSTMRPRCCVKCSSESSCYSRRCIWQRCELVALETPRLRKQAGHLSMHSSNRKRWLLDGPQCCLVQMMSRPRCCTAHAECSPQESPAYVLPCMPSIFLGDSWAWPGHTMLNLMHCPIGSPISTFSPLCMENTIQLATVSLTLTPTPWRLYRRTARLTLSSLRFDALRCSGSYTSCDSLRYS